MSTPDSATTGNGRISVKTLAIRLEPELHAQLSLIAQLRDSTITDEIRTAIEAHIALTKAAPELAARADSVLEDIEREAVQRRAAVATLFGPTVPSDPTDSTPPPATSGSTARSRGGRTGGTSN